MLVLLHSLRTAPSARAKSCTYLRWFARPGKMPAEPYFELPISLPKLRRLMQFRLGSHDLPIEQGRMARSIVPRCLRRCTLCSRHAPGDERHFMLELLECPQLDDIRAQYPNLPGAKLCTYLRWFARPDKTSTEPYYELPLPVTKLRSIFHFRVGAHSLPVEQGRIQMPKVPRHLRRCTFCATTAIDDERHCVFDCPHFQGLRLQH